MRFPTIWYVRPAKPQSLFQSLEYLMIVNVLIEHHLEFLSLKGGFIGSSESTQCQNATLLEISCHGSFNLHQTMPHWKSLSRNVISVQTTQRLGLTLSHWTQRYTI